MIKNTTVSSQTEKDARQAFQALRNRLTIILENKNFSDFQEEQLRYLLLTFRDIFAKWKYKKLSRMLALFRTDPDLLLVWELLDTPTVQLKSWINNKIVSIHLSDNVIN